ncbi:MAG: hypothetical protein AAF329_20805 [Cyanobacteria bacterium P01_A01_bin.17]
MTPQLVSPPINEQSLPEQRVVLEGVSWQQYEILLATLGDDFPALRLIYLEGILELMTSSLLHEALKKIIGIDGGIFSGNLHLVSCTGFSNVSEGG